MKRRGFLGAILAAGVAPAVVHAEVLMRWRKRGWEQCEFTGLLVPNTAGRVFYVRATGSNAAPYDTWAKAATSFLEVQSMAVEGSTIILANDWGT